MELSFFLCIIDNVVSMVGIIISSIGIMVGIMVGRFFMLGL